ncbi:MAG TPA: His-Xaa-Ser system radical SAM maturase HxsC [Rhizomicrobium sp.]|nr:His-Xaa-Ser system radical SAM maturase HxsC [Rhizomicrobium sp.]
MLALHTRAALGDDAHSGIYKVLALGEALEGAFAPSRVLIEQRGRAPRGEYAALQALGYAGIVADERPSRLPSDLVCVSDIAHPGVVALGDVVRLRENGQISILHRRGANANFLFATERCNSYCLMCSQPPRAENDDWRVDELREVVPLIDRDIPHLGITGGEPTLLGDRLAEIIRLIGEYLPRAHLHILSNARLFADPALTDTLVQAGRNVMWAVPLYADTAPRHDYIVQADGAFEDTINGLYNLAERGAAIELRMVLHAKTVGRLDQFAEFVWRSLPFVKHVAFMGLEPMGFAKLNRADLYVDPLDYRDALERAAWFLADRGIPTSIYNTPLCLLTPGAWPLARRSISDWKNVFAPECDACAVRDRCSGFFKSAGAAWRSRGIQPI